MTFARFMDLALTHPSEGYYTQTGTLLGPHGHFSTAPRLAPAFGKAVCRLVEELVDGLLRVVGIAAPDESTEMALVELGGGEGDLAKVILDDWQARRPELRRCVTYTIVEIGEPLKARQRERLAGVRDLGWHVDWAGTLDEALAGREAVVVMGNEFIDALPVHIVDVRGDKPMEMRVECHCPDAGSDPVPREIWGAVSAEAGAELRVLFGTTETAVLRPLTADGIIELRPSVGSFMRRVAAGHRAVCLLTVDYGDWYTSDTVAARCLYRRTLRGYFRHQTVVDPYARVGRQDLTADVDFRALDVHGRRNGFETVLFTTVADLLRADGGERRLEALRHEACALSSADGDALEADREATILEALLDAQGLGGAFKVMLQLRE